MKLADISIRRPVLATVMVAVLVVFGLVAYPQIGVDLFPEVEFPIVTVTAVYPGADPETVESRVIDKLEESFSTINGIKTLRSTSSENVGVVFIQFELERKAEQAVQDVRDKVAVAQRQLPPDLEPPVVEKFDVGAAPIMYLAVAGSVPTRELTRVADDVVKQKIQTLQGVGGVELVGAQDREIHVWLDPERLDSYGLAVPDVVTALKTQNVEIPGGRLNAPGRELIVKTRGQVRGAQELANIVVTFASGASVRVGDVARVEDGVEEKRSHAAIDGKSAVALIVRKQSGANTVEVAHAVHKALDKLRKELPTGITLSVPTDNSPYIEHAIHDVQFDLAFGAVLAIVIVLFFLHDWRATFISALALPSSVVATFAFVKVMGFTFNNMTMLALSLSIGILIDDAIVVIENIHRHLEMGKPPAKAAADATAEIGLAVIATTASIVAVFVPVATMRGIIGRFFLQFGLTVAFAVIVSLFVAFTLTPMLSARMLSAHSGTKSWLGRGIDRFLSRIDGAYRAVLEVAVARPKLTMLVAFVVFVVSLGMGKFVPFEFMPPDDRGQFNVKVELPTGTSLDRTMEYVDGVAMEMRKIPGVASTFTTIGGGAQGEVNRGEIVVNLVPRKQRAFSQAQGISHARQQLARRTDAVIAVEQISPIGGGGGGFRQSMVQFNIRGNDYDALNKSALEITDELRKRGGYVDLDTTYRGGKPEVAINIDRDRAADLGVPVAAIASALRTYFAGEKVTEIVSGGERVDVRVRLEDSFRARAESIRGLKVRSTSGQLVDLANIVDIGTGTGASKIDRQNRQRQVTILANLQGKVLGQALTEVEQVAAQRLPPGTPTDFAGQADIMRESAAYMLLALVLAIVLTYLVLAAQFESFIHPFTIMVSLPLSLIGALGGLLVGRMTLNIFSMIGVIMLMGLVTKNAILLVDYTNTLRREGLDRTAALLKAGPVRLRPILMTTGAMVFGMIPVALALSEGGEQRAPMAAAVIGGLLTSTLLTLLVVPAVYSVFDDFAIRLRRLVTRAPLVDQPAVGE